MIDTIGSIVLWAIPALAGVMILLDNKNMKALKDKK